MKLLPVRVVIAFGILMLIATGPLVSGKSWASEELTWEVGAQGGASFNDGDESFTQYEALLNYILPWSWKWGGVLDVGTRVTSTLGILDGGGESGGVGTLGFDFVFGDTHDFTLRAGSAATYLTKDVFGDEDLGTHFQFTSHATLTYRFWNELSARVRVQHMSNASLSDENPGINMFMVGLHYAF